MKVHAEGLLLPNNCILKYFVLHAIDPVPRTLPSPHISFPLLLKMSKHSETNASVQDFKTTVFGLLSSSLVSFAFSYIL